MSLSAELRASARLRVGLAAVTGILGLYGLLEWFDHQQVLVDQDRRVSAQLQRLSSRQAMAQWPQRAQDAQSVLQQAQRRLWAQASIGLAQAEFQDWLREQLRAISAQNVSVKVSELESPAGPRPDAAGDVPAGPAFPRISAQVEFANTDPQILLALLAAMASAQRTVVVEGLNIKPQRIEIRLAAWLQPDAGKPSP